MRQPYEPAGGGVAKVMLTPEQWADILRDSKEATKDANYRLRLISDGVMGALTKAGLDPAEALSQKATRGVGNVVSSVHLLPNC